MYCDIFFLFYVIPLHFTLVYSVFHMLNALNYFKTVMDCDMQFEKY